MSEMKALERLRAFGLDVCWRIGSWPKNPEDVANEIADAIQAEIAERYMALPHDADGVPIRVGGVLESTNAFKNWCVVMGIGDATKHDHIIYVKFEAVGDILQTWASKFIHRKPDAERGERNMLNNVFSCCIHIEELKHDLEIVLGAFYAERLAQIAFETSQEWPGETAENVLSRMLDDALLGMDGRSICEKWLRGDA